LSRAEFVFLALEAGVSVKNIGFGLSTGHWVLRMVKKDARKFPITFVGSVFPEGKLFIPSLLLKLKQLTFKVGKSLRVFGSTVNFSTEFLFLDFYMSVVNVLNMLVMKSASFIRKDLLMC
jgi:hypothetical protein